MKGIPGVYIIRNTVNGMVYVGSAVNLLKRRNEHFADLAALRHRNGKLQRAYTKYGREAFEFVVFAVIEPGDLIEVEQYLMDALASATRERGYNLSPTAGSTLGHRDSPEALERKRRAQRGRKAPKLTEEQKQHLSAVNLGKRHSPESRARMSETRAAKIYTAISPSGEMFVVRNLMRFAEERGLDSSSAYKVVAGKIGQILGWRFYEGEAVEDGTAAERARRAAARRASPASYSATSPAGEALTFSNLTRFCAEHGLNPGAVHMVVTGKCRHHKGWRFSRSASPLTGNH